MLNISGRTRVVDVHVLIHSSAAKPLSLVERCYCRSTVNSLPRGYIRELRFIHTPNCPFQVMWVTLIIVFYLGQVGFFLLVGHFSPSISNHWQARERSCTSMCTHTPLCHSCSHTCIDVGSAGNCYGSTIIEGFLVASQWMTMEK